jgi:hypothetical protein
MSLLGKLRVIYAPSTFKVSFFFSNIIGPSQRIYEELKKNLENGMGFVGISIELVSGDQRRSQDFVLGGVKGV